MNKILAAALGAIVWLFGFMLGQATGVYESPYILQMTAPTEADYRACLKDLNCLDLQILPRQTNPLTLDLI